MKKPRALVVLSFTVAIGAAIASCMSFSSGDNGGSGGTGGADNGGTGGMTGGGTGGAPDNGVGGMTDTGMGGMTTTGTGRQHATGMGGSNRPGTGGVVGGTGGMVTGTGGWSPAWAARATPWGPATCWRRPETPASPRTARRAFSAEYTGPALPGLPGRFRAGPNSCPGGAAAIRTSRRSTATPTPPRRITFCAGGPARSRSSTTSRPNGNHLKPAPAGGARAAPTTRRRHRPEDNAQRPRRLRRLHQGRAWAIAPAARAAAPCAEGNGDRRPARDRVHGDQPERPG